MEKVTKVDKSDLLMNHPETNEEDVNPPLPTTDVKEAVEKRSVRSNLSSIFRGSISAKKTIFFKPCSGD